jgi:chromosome partitioning protein
MAKSGRPLCPVVSVINMKGGVGKTQISGNVFRELFRRKRKQVLLVDFDPQFNLSQLLLTRSEYDDLKDAKKTLLHVIEPPAPTSVFQVSGDDLLDVRAVDDYAHELEQIAPDCSIRLIAGDFAISKLNLRERDRSLRVPRRRFEAFINKARGEYDLIVLDCNPSTSFLTRAALEVSSHLLIPIRPDRYSVLGAEMLFDFMGYLPTLTVALKKMLLINGMSNTPLQPEIDAVNQLRADPNLGPLTLVNDVPQSDVLKARPDYAGFALDRRAPWTTEIESRLGMVADEIATKIGL